MEIEDYFCKLLNKDNTQDTEENEIDKPSVREITKIIRSLKSNKAPGSHTITTELLKYGGLSL